jgi:rubredoxin
MREITIQVPDFATMDDDDVQHHPLARSRDGRWSALSKYLKQRFETERMNLNEAWALTSLGWQCPACGREKAEIARKTESGVILCQLERHHDHLGDLAARLLRETVCQDVPETLYTQRQRACVAVLPLVERFAETLVCMDCNAADAAMKKELGGRVQRAFSFSPSEIGAFVVALPNQPHTLDVEKGKEIWVKADADFLQRLAFVEQISGRLSRGLHDREQYTDLYSLADDRDAGMFLSLATEQLGARGRLPQLSLALRARSCANDGHRSASRRAPTRRVRTPTPQEFADHDRAMQKPGPWGKSSADWRCACCSRSKQEIMRISSKGKWTGHIHEICDYREEVDERALAYRSAHRTESPIFGSHLKITICQDCKLVLTDAGKLRGDGRGGDNCLSPDVIRSLVGDAKPNRRHEIADQLLQHALEASRAWSSAADDFWEHCGHASEASLRLLQYTKGRGMPLALAKQHAIADLTQSGSLPGWNAEEIFEWLLRERDRLDG